MVWVLLLASAVMLFVGNQVFPVVEGVDFTPFEAAGAPFFLVVAPAAALLAWLKHSTPALAFVVVHATVLAALVARYLGTGPAVLVLLGYSAAVLIGIVASRVIRPSSRRRGVARTGGGITTS
jgi:hypothetical protein